MATTQELSYVHAQVVDKSSLTIPSPVMRKQLADLRLALWFYARRERQEASRLSP
jgi:hypothetical protein